MGEHIPNDELSRFAQDRLAVEHERREEIESHIANCVSCGASFDFYEVAENDLGDLAVWQSIVGSTATAMSAYANQCAAEDAEAELLLKEYLNNPRRAALANLRNQRKFHTGGVVRRLNVRAHEVVASRPLDALIFADLAQAVADLLPNDTYPNHAVYELRGTAWKERANALLRLAAFDEALESLRRAERAYKHLRSSGHGLAAVELVRAAVYYERGELQKAAEHVELADHAYVHLGLERHRMKAVLLRGQIAYEALDYGAAAKTFQQVIEFGEEIDDAREIAKVAAHAFRVLKKAGNVTGALTALAYLKEAAAKRQVTSETLKAVRAYLRRVEREPDLLFERPSAIPR
ncbi:MAG TPA: hypothetical protein VEK11_05580 [Thermoanaerobaculia bacterium]|nr:hypothetical protein [Thermoanaerobaculia bacterium]